MLQTVAASVAVSHVDRHKWSTPLNKKKRKNSQSKVTDFLQNLNETIETSNRFDVLGIDQDLNDTDTTRLTNTTNITPEKHYKKPQKLYQNNKSVQH